MSAFWILTYSGWFGPVSPLFAAWSMGNGDVVRLATAAEIGR